jgi:hypothetical protein
MKRSKNKDAPPKQIAVYSYPYHSDDELWTQLTEVRKEAA